MSDENIIKTGSAGAVDFDLAVVGSGFGGSLVAMIARRLGLSVILLERGKHPRFAIGESTSPLMNLLIEQLAHRYDLPRLLPLTAYGTWQESYPQIACGLKRGFSYYHHEAGKRFCTHKGRENELLVAASPSDRVSDTHWFRADVDDFLVQEAIALGVEYLDNTLLDAIEFSPCGRATMRGERHGQPVRVQAHLVVDATGPRGFLSRALHLPPARFQDYPATQTLFSHFVGVHRTEQLPDFQSSRGPEGDFSGSQPPYLPDDAALHHVFDGGWMWVLRFNNGVTSAGIAVTPELADELNLSEGEPAWKRFLKRFPSVADQFAEAQPVQPFIYSAQLPYRCSAASGEGWLLLPSAAAFVDPLFSTGMPLTLLGIERLGLILENWHSAPETRNAQLAHLGERTLQEADATAQFIGGCYAAFSRFSLFAAFSMFYFAAASYSEMVRRLDKRHLVSQFLASDRSDFAPAWLSAAQQLRRCAPSLNREDFEALVAKGIAPLNIAGLANTGKHNWYGVDLDDLVRASQKLELSSEAMRAILDNAVWAQI